MSNPPHEPLNYVSPNTLAWRIECITGPDGLTINTRPPTARMLCGARRWRDVEVTSPPIPLKLFPAAVVSSV